MTTTVVTNAARRITVMGVLLERVDAAVFRQSYKLVIEKEPPADLTRGVKELATHFQKSGKQLMECEGENACGGGSPLDFGACPYCGAEDGAEDDAASKRMGPRGPIGKTLAETLGSASAPNALVKVDQNGTTPVVLPAAVITVTSSAMNEKVLDEAVAKIRVLKTQGTTVLYQLGIVIYGVYSTELWRQRGATEGKAAYKNFTQWVAAEVQIHQRTAFKMMQVAREFTEEQVTQYGNSILKVLLAAPKEDRQELLDKIDKGVVGGKRGVEREVEKIRKRKGVKHVAGAGKTKRGEKGTRAARASKRKVVTVAFPAGRNSVELFARKLKKSDPDKRAKKLADRPWGKLELQNGTAIYFAIVETAVGSLTLSVEARRED